MDGTEEQSTSAVFAHLTRTLPHCLLPRGCPTVRHLLLLIAICDAGVWHRHATYADLPTTPQGYSGSQHRSPRSPAHEGHRRTTSAQRGSKAEMVRSSPTRCSRIVGQQGERPDCRCGSRYPVDRQSYELPEQQSLLAVDGGDSDSPWMWMGDFDAPDRTVVILDAESYTLSYSCVPLYTRL